MQTEPVTRARDILPEDVTPIIELQTQLYALAGVPGKEDEFEALRLKLERAQADGDAVS